MNTTMTAIRPIRTDADHEAALREIDALWGAPEGSPEGDRLDVLVTLVEAYESDRWPVTALDPVEALELVIESGEHSRADLADIIGQSRATEVLKRQRALTLPMIRSISDAWHVPVKTLAQSYRLKDAAGGGRISFAKGALSGRDSKRGRLSSKAKIASPTRTRPRSKPEQ